MFLLIATVFFTSQVAGKVSIQEESFCKRPLLYADGPEHPVGYPIKENYTRGNLMYFRCLDGFELVGNRIRVCDEKGHWSGNAPWCNRTSCPQSNVYNPEHGSYRGDSFKIGSKITFQCDLGYYLEGNRTLECRPDGSWSARNPYCTSLCKKKRCKEGMKCVLHPKMSWPQCICKEEYDCPFKYKPVCGSDGKSYGNKCLLGMVACRTRKEIQATKNCSCSAEDTFGKQDCTPCPKIQICKALYASGYSFLGKPEHVEATENNYIVTFRITETYKGSGRAGDSIKVHMKRRQRTCSCVPRLPNAKVLVMGQYGKLKNGTYIPVIDENTYLEKFYSHKQLNLCWLY